MSTCLICDGNQLKLIWNSKIRNGAKTFTKKNEKIYQCKNCELIFLKINVDYLRILLLLVTNIIKITQ